MWIWIIPVAKGKANETLLMAVANDKLKSWWYLANPVGGHRVDLKASGGWGWNWLASIRGALSVGNCWIPWSSTLAASNHQALNTFKIFTPFIGLRLCVLCWVLVRFSAISAWIKVCYKFWLELCPAGSTASSRGSKPRPSCRCVASPFLASAPNTVPVSFSVSVGV